jgi:hypothetical protein
MRTLDQLSGAVLLFAVVFAPMRRWVEPESWSIARGDGCAGIRGSVGGLFGREVVGAPLGA